jgi:hypothetical protein
MSEREKDVEKSSNEVVIRAHKDSPMCIVEYTFFCGYSPLIYKHI